MNKQPSFQFYPGDWMKDPALRAVSSAARGIWIDMLCLMWESARRGYLVHPTGRAVSTDQLARMTGNDLDGTAGMLSELEDCGVCSRTGDGILYSRRMDKDARISAVRSRAGKEGAQYGHLGGRPPNDPDKTAKTANGTAKKGQSKGQTERQNNPPSSSSSTSLLSNESNSPAAGAAEPAPADKPPKQAKPSEPPADGTDVPGYEFRDFWDAYGKKQDTAKCEKFWDKLRPPDRALIRDRVPAYVASTPDPKYRKAPLTWLNGKCWLDEAPVQPQTAAPPAAQSSGGGLPDDFFDDLPR